MSVIQKALLATYRKIVSVVTTITDPYFNLTTLLLSGSGTNGAQNNTFLDQSVNNHTIVRNGNSTQGSFSPFTPRGWSAYFDGSNEFLETADNVALNPSTSDFVMEAWVYLTNGATVQGINGKGTAGVNGYNFYISESRVLTFVWNGTGGATITGGTLLYNTWHHVAVVRNSNVIRLYLDGVGAGSSTACTTDITSTAVKYIGQGRGSNPIFGYISNYRMIKGSRPSGYDATSSTLPVPTSALTNVTGTSLLTCQSSGFIDNSSNDFTLTPNGTNLLSSPFSPFSSSSSWSSSTHGGSAFFDGTGDYLTVANSAALSLGTSDYTLETWVRPMAGGVGGERGILSKSIDGSSGGFTLSLDGGFLSLKIGANNINTNSFVPSNTWSHIAVSRQSSNNRIFVNGKLVSSNVNGANISGSNGNFRIASARTPTTASNWYIGHLSGTRVLKDTALYTANFSIPTSPPTEISNTSILCNYINAGIYDSTTVNDFETVNDVQISSTVSKFGNTSLFFDGVNDYLFGRFTPETAFPAVAPAGGKFTIESWVYPTTSNVTLPIIARGDSFTAGVFDLYIDANNTLRFNSGANTIFPSNTPATTISSNTWTHVAIVREGTGTGQTKFYINGTVSANATINTNYALRRRVIVGANRVLSSFYKGYMQDLRITVGHARYTANFTPSTTAFPTQ